jgi:hypothetical protein
MVPQSHFPLPTENGLLASNALLISIKLKLSGSSRTKTAASFVLGSYRDSDFL